MAAETEVGTWICFIALPFPSPPPPASRLREPPAGRGVESGADRRRGPGVRCPTPRGAGGRAGLFPDAEPVGLPLPPPQRPPVPVFTLSDVPGVGESWLLAGDGGVCGVGGEHGVLLTSYSSPHALFYAPGPAARPPPPALRPRGCSCTLQRTQDAGVLRAGSAEEGDARNRRQWKQAVLIVANFPLAVMGRRIACPRARGWAHPGFPPAQLPLPEQDRSGWLV